MSERIYQEIVNFFGEVVGVFATDVQFGVVEIYAD
jgi:hypothetical protein